MAFTPAITAIFSADGTTVSIPDASGLFDNITNIVGWNQPDATCTPTTTVLIPSLISSIDYRIRQTSGAIDTGTITLTTGWATTYVDGFNYITDLDISGLGLTNDIQDILIDITINFISITCSFSASTGSLTSPSGLVIYNLPTFTPSINACLTNKCDSLELTDTLGTAWSLNPGTDTTITKSLTLEIYRKTVAVTTGSTVTTSSTSLLTTSVIVNHEPTFQTVNQFPTTIIGDIDLTAVDWSYGDGVFLFKYIYAGQGVNQAAFTLEYEFEMVFYCAARACVDLLWLKVAGDCDPFEKNRLMVKAQEAEVLLIGVQGAAACLQDADVTRILTSLNKICDYVDTADDCGC